MYLLISAASAVIIACGILVTYRKWLPTVVLILYAAAFLTWVGGLSFRSYPLPASQAVVDKLLQRQWNLLYGRIVNGVAYVLVEDDPPRLFSLRMDEKEQKRVRRIMEGMQKGMAASLILKRGQYRIEGKWSPPPVSGEETK